MSAEHVVLRPVEQTAWEFRTNEFPDIAVRVENVSSEREACVKARQFIKRLRHEQVEPDVTRNV